MKILSVNTNNSKSFNDVNKKNKIISIIVFICITILFLAELYTYTTILSLQENIDEQDKIIEGLTENISAQNGTIAGLTANLYDLSKQQQSYDILLFTKLNNTNTKNYVIQSGNGTKEMETPIFSETLNYISNNNETKNVKLKYGIYNLDAHVTFDSKSDLILDGQNSILNLNGYSISFASDDHNKNRNNLIKNFKFINGTLDLENSYGTTIENCYFENSESAFEMSNTGSWSETNTLVRNNWKNCQTAITFKSHTGNATPSYENTVIDQCYIDLGNDSSVGILVEEGAHFSNSRISNTRIWMHAYKPQIQTGLYVEDDVAMTNTILSGVVFESFGNGTIYGIYLGKNCTGYSDEGVSFIGEHWEAKISNFDNTWLPGAFRTDPTKAIITFDTSTTNKCVIHREPFSIESFDGFINITDISPNEQVIVQISLNFRDHTITGPITLPTFSGNRTYYELTKQNLYDLYPSQNIIQNIEVFARTSISNSKTKVTISIFGIAK